MLRSFASQVSLRSKHDMTPWASRMMLLPYFLTSWLPASIHLNGFGRSSFDLSGWFVYGWGTMPGIRMHTFMNNRRIKNPLVRALVGVIGLVIALTLVAGLVLIALPLAIGVVVVGALAAAILPRLRGRPMSRRRPAAAPTDGPLPRRPGQMKRAEPVEPPRTLG